MGKNAGTKTAAAGAGPGVGRSTGRSTSFPDCSRHPSTPGPSSRLSGSRRRRRREARLRRQKRLPLVDYCAFIGEAAIRTPFGGAAFGEQLNHLIKVTERGIGVRLVPEHRPHPALVHSWMMLEFPDTRSIVHVELLHSVVYPREEVVTPYIAHRTMLSQLALSTAETRDMPKQLI